MSPKHFIAPLAVALLFATHPLRAEAAGAIDAVFVEPDSYSDIGRDEISRQKTLRILASHFKTMADRLSPTQRLRLEFVDIDLAGKLGIRRLDNIRWGSSSPNFKFYYRLTEGANIAKQGYVDLFELNHDLAARSTYLNRTELVSERRILDKWFEQTILAQ